MPMSPAFDRFVAPARTRPALWRIGVGLLIVFMVMLVWVVILFGGVWLWGGFDFVQTLLPEMAESDTPRGTLILLATFVGMALGTVAAARLLHKRGTATLFGPGPGFGRDFAWGVGTIAAVFALSSLIFGAVGDAPEPNLYIGLWLKLLIPALILVLIQTGAEEMLFRGYLMQQIAARCPVAAVYIVVPAVIFGALHFDPTTGGGNAWMIAGAAGVFGLVAADLTRVTGSLAVAWGLHFANNVAAILVMATQGTITGLALFVTPFAADDTAALRPLILLDAGVLLAIWAFLRWRLAR